MPRSMRWCVSRACSLSRTSWLRFMRCDGCSLQALVMRAGFREVRVRADVKLSRFPSAEHFVRCVFASGPTMVETLAAQGPDVLNALVAEVTDATRDYVDDEGWAAPQASNIITAVV